VSKKTGKPRKPRKPEKNRKKPNRKKKPIKPIRKSQNISGLVRFWFLKFETELNRSGSTKLALEKKKSINSIFSNPNLNLNHYSHFLSRRLSLLSASHLSKVLCIVFFSMLSASHLSSLISQICLLLLHVLCLSSLISDGAGICKERFKNSSLEAILLQNFVSSV
jgi:hypothetical protein